MKDKDKKSPDKCINFNDRRKKEMDLKHCLEEMKYDADMYNEEDYEIMQELFDDFLVGVEKSFQRDCKRKMEWTLEEIISYLKKDEIKAKLITLSIKFLKKDKKSELVDRYMQNYESVYKNLFKYITEDLYSDLIKIKLQGYSIDLDLVENIKFAGLLDILGITTIGMNENKEIRYFIPREIVDIIEAFDFNSKDMKRNKEIVEVTKGLIRAYGAIDRETLMDALIDYRIIFKEDNKEKIDSIIRMNLGADESFIFTEGYYLDSSIAFSKDLEKFIKIEGEFKRFSKEEVLNLKLIRDKIREVEFIGIRNFLRQFNIDEEEIEEEILEIYDIYQLNLNSEEEIKKHIDRNYDMPEEMKEEYLGEIMNVLNAVPNWKLKGFSKNELKNKNYKIINEIKRNRSELCSCGSNKKFKDCCGKKVIKVEFKKNK